MTSETGEHLFSPLSIRDVRLRNRIVVSPMCQYSGVDGRATDWHLVHLGSRAAGGAGAVLAEATAVLPDGRISPDDLGLWSDSHIEPLARVFRFVEEQGAAPGVQLAHAGRKASTTKAWLGGGPLAAADGGWAPVAPSPLAFDQDYPTPQEIDRAGIRTVIEAFASAARRVLDAGGKIVEVHAAHGYLLHEFLSPLTNRRKDEYGGSFENRTRIVREVVQAVRRVWPERWPLFVRLSCTDWAEGGWSPEESVELARRLKPLGADVIDCSSGGLLPKASIPVGPGFQVPFAETIRREAGIHAMAVGMITGPEQADRIVRSGQADLVALGREFLRDPYWPLRAAKMLKQEPPVPKPYLRAF